MTHPVMRQDPLTGRWVLFSTARGQRPIRLSNLVSTPTSIDPQDDPFAPGNESETPGEVFALRPQGSPPNSKEWELRIVPNRYPALTTQSESTRSDTLPAGENLAYGFHEVVIETPRCESRFHRLSPSEITCLFVSVQERIRTLSTDSRIRSIAYFKNEGQAAGASLPHVHSQLMAFEFVPPFLQEQFNATSRHWDSEGKTADRNWFEAFLHRELNEKIRIVEENNSIVSLCPYASRFAYETWLIPKRRTASFIDVTAEELAELGNMLHRVLNRLEDISPALPFNFALLTAPVGQEHVPHFHWHLELYPRVNGFAGLECGFGCHINTVLPEQAAQLLATPEQTKHLPTGS